MWDFVVYDAETKEIISILQDVSVDPKFLINTEYVGIYIPHGEYAIIDGEDGKCYFKNLNNVLYLDEYRNKYID